MSETTQLSDSGTYFHAMLMNIAVFYIVAYPSGYLAEELYKSNRKINLPAEEYDAPLGISTGAGEIFGASGGVMEAALRTVYEVVTGQTLESLDFTDCRGLTGVIGHRTFRRGPCISRENSH